MRWALLLPVLTLAGCAKNTFVVEDPKHLVRTATLFLCDSETPLDRSGNTFNVTRRVNCEGDGEIRLIYNDRGPEHCWIGYVTSDAEQHFHFRAERSGCSPVF
ncbi:MAG TPA: hypothetical protein VH331_16300 [Allosphingosinicella sp.]|jgi:hypothetical protein|nr:hypothetical protein [Allosphingosinicella sp.]